MSSIFNKFLFASLFPFISCSTLFSAQPNLGVVVYNNQGGKPRQPNQPNQPVGFSDFTLGKGAKGLAWMALAAATGYGTYMAGAYAFQDGSSCLNYYINGKADSLTSDALIGAGCKAIAAGAVAASFLEATGRFTKNGCTHLISAGQDVYGGLATVAHATRKTFGWLTSRAGLWSLGITAAIAVPVYSYKLCCPSPQ